MSPTQELQTTPPGSPARTVGLIAVGHSALTGEGSIAPQQPARQNSWATGDNPSVESIATRMIERDPLTQGHVANTAEGGATADKLVSQLDRALTDVATPELVIIQVIDNDLRCDGTDPVHTKKFEDDIAAALQLMRQRSPHSKVLLVSQVGRPERHATMRMDADQVTPYGDGECDFFDSTGTYIPEKAAHLTEIIIGYESAQARACAAAGNCWTDEGAGSEFREEWEYFEGADNIHMNTVGLASLAAHVWPSVLAVLAEPTP